MTLTLPRNGVTDATIEAITLVATVGPPSTDIRTLGSADFTSPASRTVTLSVDVMAGAVVATGTVVQAVLAIVSVEAFLFAEWPIETGITLASSVDMTTLAVDALADLNTLNAKVIFRAHLAAIGSSPSRCTGTTSVSGVTLGTILAVAVILAVRAKLIFRTCYIASGTTPS